MKTILLLILSCLSCLALTPEQNATLRAEVVKARAGVGTPGGQKICDTCAIKNYLTSRPQTGSEQQTVTVTKDATLVAYEQQHVALLNKYGMQAGVSFDVCVATMAAADAGKTDAEKIAILKDAQLLTLTYTWLREHGCAFDATEGQASIQQTITVPTYGDPIIGFPVTGADIEAVQR